MQQDVASLCSSTTPLVNLEEPRTKAVFREMDGFLCLMNVLSALSTSPIPRMDPRKKVAYALDQGQVDIQLENPQMKGTDHMQECIRLVFVLIGEALEGCIANEVYFRTKVGWESLSDALDTLLSGSSRRLRSCVLSHLLSLSLNDFQAPFSNYFIATEIGSLDEVDERVAEVKVLKENSEAWARCKINHSAAMRVLWNFVQSDGDRQTCYALYKIVEVLFGACHRNGAVLSSLGIVGDVFERFLGIRATLKSMNDDQEDKGSEVEKKDLEKEKQVLQRLLRKLLEMGANTTEARRLFQATVIRQESSEETLDPEILEILRFGMKSRWVEHFSLEGRASIVVSDEHKWKHLPKEGLSFFVRSRFPKMAHFHLMRFRCGFMHRQCRLETPVVHYCRLNQSWYRHQRWLCLFNPEFISSSRSSPMGG